MPPDMPPEPGDAAALEAGRLAFARPWRFVMGVSTIGGLPLPAGSEVAFAGRSNVGKSSLINALVGQSALARTSNTPGRTQELNYFTDDDGLVIVDMPGYGYARAPLEHVRNWTRLVFDFLRGRASLRRVYVLIDARHGIKANDREALDILDKAAVSYQIVLTKCDKQKPEALRRMIDETTAAIRKRAAAHPEVLATSSATGAGLDRLRAEIAALRAPTGRSGD